MAIYAPSTHSRSHSFQPRPTLHNSFRINRPSKHAPHACRAPPALAHSTLPDRLCLPLTPQGHLHAHAFRKLTLHAPARAHDPSCPGPPHAVRPAPATLFDHAPTRRIYIRCTVADQRKPDGKGVAKRCERDKGNIPTARKSDVGQRFARRVA
ncbi:hypothetical protein EJ06DRAFT_393508 [Trichodelitschia bisporula]|uniref:Uncharacterized protein n=1 Tax=Trichodelitschia bisporula TaxID=703511 RepID=A0A6G1I070_9PEZI|nr:hypothetical protein EJ06DRAFT_393508 [Trichodelitschia bisporula]